MFQQSYPITRLSSLSHFFFCVRLPDRCSASRGDGAQDSGVDINTFFTKPPAASTAAVFRNQGSIQTRWGPHPQQEHERCLSTLTWKTRTFLSFHSACGQRGTRGNLIEVCTFASLLLLSMFVDLWTTPHSGF